MAANKMKFDIEGMSPDEFRRDVSFERACEALREGSPVIFPTDTVYGIGVAINYASSPALLYELKQRASTKPIPLLLGEIQDLFLYGDTDPSRMQDTISSSWPGALTLIVPATSLVPCAFTSSDLTIGVRVPNAPCIRALIHAVGPLATTSANISGQDASSTLADITCGLVDKVPLVLKDDQIGSNIASRVLSCVDEEIRVLR